VYQPDDGYILAETFSCLYLIDRKLCVWTEYIILLVTELVLFPPGSEPDSWVFPTPAWSFGPQLVLSKSCKGHENIMETGMLITQSNSTKGIRMFAPYNTDVQKNK
jgi:hypothetical protein